MTIVPFEPWHLLQIDVQPAQRINDETLRDENNAKELAAAGPCFTALLAGAPVAIGGIVGRGPGRAVGWAVISPRALTQFRSIHRAVKAFIDLHNFRRLEIMVDPRHAGAVRWAQHLGFEREGTCRSYAPDGRDLDMYARIGG